MKKNRLSLLIILSIILLMSVGCKNDTPDAEQMAEDLLQIAQQADEEAQQILQPTKITQNQPVFTEPSSEDGFVEAVVTEVIEGDNLTVTINGIPKKIRMIGVDAPETKHPTKPNQFFAQEALDFATEKLKDKTVYLEKDVSESDEEGRFLFYVWLKKPSSNPAKSEDVVNHMFNARLLINGFAKPAAHFPNVKYEMTFQEVSDQARNQFWGIWNDPALFTDPTAIPAQTSEQPAPNTPPTYIGNSNSLKFHHPNCTNVGQMKEEHKIPLHSRDEALNAGYTPCPLCNP